ncbi:hypothetical protein EV421DRAFT_1909161 [Armillaria borealis]|uniref:Xylanolytic transcriptional activator regulatory domain-containing protein n=1 Tax=Armillaria borealis TaxID=47425 RepID=A0AA39J222_9AGAR|nr:hypothetical protein EV421DRAFT_1909161 [Armillaria borealis]
MSMGSNHGSTVAGASAVVPIQTLFDNHIPRYRVAQELCKTYTEVSGWLFGAVSEAQVYDELIPLYYKNNLPALQGDADNLALLFSVLCLGAFGWPTPDDPDKVVVCDKYKRSSLMALSYCPSPSVAYVQTLTLLAIYEEMRTGENTHLLECTRMAAFTIGLEADVPGQSELDIERRRTLIWDIAIRNTLQSLAFGRPLAVSLPTTCRFPPKYLKLRHGMEMANCEDLIPDFSVWKSLNANIFLVQFWRAQFSELLRKVAEVACRPSADYISITQLDQAVRDFPLPSSEEVANCLGASWGFTQALSYHLPHHYKQIAFLYLHLRHFQRALEECPQDPSSTQYAYSFTTGYFTARGFLDSSRSLFDKFPTGMACLWDFWNHVFSALMMLYQVAKYGRRCPSAPEALLLLQSQVAFFKMAASYRGRAASLLPAVQHTYLQARALYDRGGYNQHPGGNHKFQDHSDEDSSEEEDSYESHLSDGHPAYSSQEEDETLYRYHGSSQNSSPENEGINHCTYVQGLGHEFLRRGITSNTDGTYVPKGIGTREISVKNWHQTNGPIAIDNQGGAPSMLQWPRVKYGNVSKPNLTPNGPHGMSGTRSAASHWLDTSTVTDAPKSEVIEKHDMRSATGDPSSGSFTGMIPNQPANTAPRGPNGNWEGMSSLLLQGNGPGQPYSIIPQTGSTLTPNYSVIPHGPPARNTRHRDRDSGDSGASPGFYVPSMTDRFDGPSSFNLGEKSWYA